MKEVVIDKETYRLPGNLSPWAEGLYVHLIKWKRRHGMTEPGPHKHRGQILYYDAILTDEDGDISSKLIYEPVREALDRHVNSKFRFRIHKFFNHMASSQAANINLFLPILLTERPEEVLRAARPDMAKVERSELDNGYRIEFWDEGLGSLNDKNARTGTDSDIGIAYRNHEGELCLWLVEHKLTEPEFTTCGGYKSSGRDKSKHLCSSSYTDLLANKNLCYYHDRCNYRYWEITEKNKKFFENAERWDTCPFKGGINQLWRNQVMGLAIEEDKGAYKDYKHVYFSVVHHPGNHALDSTMAQYRELVSDNPKFSSFTSDILVRQAQATGTKELLDWARWYEELYAITD